MRHEQIFRRDSVVEACLALFLVSAAGLTVLLEHPDSPVRMSLVDPLQRRGLLGLAMGLTAAALIYSHVGMRSGTHTNPAVTLACARVARMRILQAVGCVTAWFCGGGASHVGETPDWPRGSWPSSS